MISKGYLRNGQSYANFSSETNLYLHKANYDLYLSQWLEFIKSLLDGVYFLRDEEVK